VTQKLRAWLLVLMVTALCGASLGGLMWYRSRDLTVASMLRRMPVQDALVVYIDFSKLRSAIVKQTPEGPKSILQLFDGAKVSQDPEYKRFVSQTDFDYTQDLDSALVVLAPAGEYMLVRGRFEWTSLKKYVQAQDGNCNNLLCRMAGSTPERHISFLPIQSNLMALAVSSDDSAVMRLTETASGQDSEVPHAPVWVSIPSSVMKSGPKLPEDAQGFARSLERAESSTLEFEAEGDHYALKLSVRCTNQQDAAALQADLTQLTAAILKNLQLNHHQPDPKEFAGILSAGRFTTQGRRVFGHWAIDKAFLENILAG
jgi:hypothetical protein